MGSAIFHEFEALEFCQSRTSLRGSGSGILVEVSAANNMHGAYWYLKRMCPANAFRDSPKSVNWRSEEESTYHARSDFLVNREKDMLKADPVFAPIKSEDWPVQSRIS
jgi:hypothetical protein